MKTKTLISGALGGLSWLWGLAVFAHPHPAGTPAAGQFHWHAELGLAIALLAAALAGGVWWWNAGSRVRQARSRRDQK